MPRRQKTDSPLLRALATDDATDEMRDAAELAEEWLQSSFERLTLDQIQKKTADLRRLQAA